jgi:hypothetical protein
MLGHRALATGAVASMSADAIAPVIAALSLTEARDGLVAVGVLAIKASASPIEAGDVLSSVGATPVAASAAISEDGDACASQCTLAIKAAQSAIEEADLLSASSRLQGEDLALPPAVRRGGPWPDPHDAIARVRRERELDLRHAIDEAWDRAHGESESLACGEPAPPDLDAVCDALVKLAEERTEERLATAIASRELSAEDEAVAVLLLAA